MPATVPTVKQEPMDDDGGGVDDNDGSAGGGGGGGEVVRRDYEPLVQQSLQHFKLQPLDRDEEMEILHHIKEETDETTRDRVVDSLAASYPAGDLSQAFMAAKDVDDVNGGGRDGDPLSRSCYAEIRLDKTSKLDRDDDDYADDDSDDELTSLAWLQDTDLLRGMRMSDCDSPSYAGDGGIDGGDPQKENNNNNQFVAGYYGQPHPPHVPYNPKKHINSKPPYSFSCLIFMAIEDNPDKKLPVKDIYHWILSHFPYFQNAPTGWKNSVRHNLSLNKCFKKVEKDRCSVSLRHSKLCVESYLYVVQHS